MFSLARCIVELESSTLEYLPTLVHKVLTLVPLDSVQHWHPLLSKALIAHTIPTLGVRQTLNEKLYANVFTVYAKG